MKRRSGILAIAAAAATMALTAGPVRAEFPEKPVEMTILFGSTAKTIAQVLSSEMSKQLGKPVVPVDRPGGGGSVGYSHVKGTAADGYSIVWNSNSVSTAYYQGNMKLTYKDFVPIARISVETPAVAVRSDSGWTTLQDVAKAAKASSSKLKIGHSGVGSFTHVVSAAIVDQLGIGDKVIYVPYDAGKAPTELLGGRIDVAVQWPGQFVSHMKAGTVRLLAVTGAERVQQVPDVKTAKEQGIDVDLTMWRGLAAPAGTPAPVISKLEEAAKKAAASPEFQATLAKLGAQASFMPAGEFGKLMAADDARLGKIMSDLGMAKAKTN